MCPGFPFAMLTGHFIRIWSAPTEATGSSRAGRDQALPRPQRTIMFSKTPNSGRSEDRPPMS
jgi:hypothetical protein